MVANRQELVLRVRKSALEAYRSGELDRWGIFRGIWRGTDGFARGIRHRQRFPSDTPEIQLLQVHSLSGVRIPLSPPEC